MGKQSNKPGNGSSSSRHAPYPAKHRGSSRPGFKGKAVQGKARVEVKFEGTQPSVAAATTASTSSESFVNNSTIKGKGKALDASKEEEDVKPFSSAQNIDQAADTQISISTGSFVVIAGSYEKLLYGIEGSFPPLPSSRSTGEEEEEEEKKSDLDFKPIFIFPAHLACVKAVAASPGGKWLATGSEDEFIKIWDLRRRKEVGSLSQHTGSITSLHFPSSAHLLSTSVDGTIALFRTSDWTILKSLKGHSGRVNHVDVHPTGRVALSVGKDQTLKMWDLMRGRGAASLALGSEAEIVKFSPLGTHFAVLFQKKIEIYSLTLKLLCTLETKSRFNCLEFALIPAQQPESDEEEAEAKEVLCVGTEKGSVEVYSVEIGVAEEEEADEDESEDEGDEQKEKEDGEGEGEDGENTKQLAEVELIGTLVGHTNRIKSLSTLPFITPPSTPGGMERDTVLISTVSSDGKINVYDLGAFVHASTARGILQEEREGGKAIGVYDTKGSRLTCVFLADGKKAGAVVGRAQGQARAQPQGQKREITLDGAADKKERGVGFVEKVEDEEESGDDDEDDEEAEDIYEQGDDAGEDDDDEDDEMDVEFEDEEEEEENEDADEAELE